MGPDSMGKNAASQTAMIAALNLTLGTASAVMIVGCCIFSTQIFIFEFSKRRRY
jgi:uncharacterized membrane protein YgdD (TMEM256/DUF423 family)